MFSLNIRLKNAAEVDEFKSIITEYDNKVSMIIGGHVVARPMLTSAPYITPLDNITLNFHNGSINEFMQMIQDMNKYITDRQDGYVTPIIHTVRAAIAAEEVSTSIN